MRSEKKHHRECLESCYAQCFFIRELVVNQFVLLIGFSKSDFAVSRFQKFGEKIVLTNGSWILRVRSFAKSVCDR